MAFPNPQIIKAQEPFRVFATQFAFGKPTVSTKLKMSIDGTNWDEIDGAISTTANVNVVNNVVPGLWYMLEGNLLEVPLIY